MPALVVWLSRIFSSRLGQWLTSALVFMGLAFGTQEFAIGPLRSYLETAWGGLGGQVLATLGYANIDKACTIILSAVAARAALNSGALFLKRRQAGP